jgi:subtilase-type serine protease
MSGSSVSAVHLLSNSCWEAARWCIVADGSWRVASDEAAAYSFATGSSFAAPQVSGALAVLAEAFPDLSPHQLRVRLLASAEDGFFTPDATVELAQGYSKGYSVIYGHGFLDIEAALRPIGKMAMATVGGGQVPAGQPVLKTGSALGDAVTLSLNGTDVAVKDTLAASFAMPAEALTAGVRPTSRARSALDRTLATDLEAARQSAPRALSAPFAALDGPMIGLSGPAGISAAVLLPQDGTQAMGISLAGALTDGPTRLELGVKLARDDGALFSLDGDQADMASISLGLTQELLEGAFLTLAGEVGMTDLGGDTALGTAGSARFDALGITFGQTGIFTDDDRFTIGVGMPVAVASGRSDLTLPVTSKAGASFQSVAVDLSPDDRQLDFEIGYQAALSEALEMKLSLLHSDNFGNRAGQTETGGLVAFTFRF